MFAGFRGSESRSCEEVVLAPEPGGPTVRLTPETSVYWTMTPFQILETFGPLS